MTSVLCEKLPHVKSVQVQCSNNNAKALQIKLGAKAVLVINSQTQQTTIVEVKKHLECEVLTERSTLSEQPDHLLLKMPLLKGLLLRKPMSAVVASCRFCR